jgi:hypothetical protein
MIGPTNLLHPSPTPHLKTFQVFLIYCPRNTWKVLKCGVGGIYGRIILK